MNLRNIVVPLLGGALLVAGWRWAGWGGVALAAGALVMYLLLHFNRTVHVLRRAADRPVGYVDSAVMLNARLKPGVNLLHVTALTRSLGQQLSAPGEQPEAFRWTDAGGSSVTCEFAGGRLAKWSLARPEEPGASGPGPAASTGS